MNKFFSVNFFLFSVILSIISFVNIQTDNYRIQKQKVNWFSSSNDLFSESNSWVESKLASMTLREKIAQMIITRSDGFTLDPNSAEYKRLTNLIVNEKIGGVIFFKGNSVQQTELTNTLQSFSGTPLLISADYERGTGMRLNDGSIFPSNMALGATRNPELAYKMGFQIAKECRTIGVHQNYAPVADINNNSLNPIINVRSYGEDPQLVSSMSEEFIRGLQDGNVIATAKHFPGHGDTDIDSHNDLPVLNFSKERLDNLELIPFKNAIQKGVKSVMIAHLSLPALEKESGVPASLSRNIVENLLIDELKFKGLIVTDALNMAGVVNHFSTEEVALRCVNAGIDLILMPQGETVTIDAIEYAVNNGTVSPDRIETSARKILNAKNWLKLDQYKDADVSSVPSVVNSSEAQAISQQIADESLTLVKNKGDILPFSNPSEKSCLIISLNNGNEKANSDYFLARFNDFNKFKSVSFYDLTGDITDSQEIINDSKEYDIIVVPIYAKVKIKTGTVGLPQSQTDLINSLVSEGKKVAVISFGNPYLIQGFPEVDSYICAYADAETSINSSINSIYGTIKFKGRLPVSISNEYKFGDGSTN